MNVSNMSATERKALMEQIREADRREREEAKALSPSRMVRMMTAEQGGAVIRAVVDAVRSGKVLHHSAFKFRAVAWHWSQRGQRASEKIILPDGSEAYRLIWRRLPEVTIEESITSWQLMAESTRKSFLLDAMELGKYMPMDTDRLIARRPAGTSK